MNLRASVWRSAFVVLGAVVALLLGIWLYRHNPALLVWIVPGVVSAVVGGLMFKLQSAPTDDWPERRDIGLTCGVLSFGLAGGFYALYAATAYVNFTHRTAGVLAVEMWSLATYAAGFGIGFLFGIPRVLQSDNPGAAGGSYIQRVNTNLEQISDWLTKIIVGLGLVQLQQLPGFLKGISLWAAASLPLGRDTSLTQVAAFATAFLVYFVVTGFLAGYLLTRLYLAGAFRRADQPATPVTVSPAAGLTTVPTVGATVPPDPADRLRAYWLSAPGGAPDPAKETALLDWLGNHGLKDLPLAKFFAGADYLAQRQQAAADFQL